MSPEEIRELIKLVEESNIDELEVSRWGRRVRIRKNMTNNRSSDMTVKEVDSKKKITENVELLENVVKEKSIQDDKLFEVKSPMVGTFYRAPAPDSEPYIKEGEFVRKGQVLCIIEAMKLMNEIEAERDGKIVRIVVQNAQPVEYNQTLFLMSEE
jgi:acetyl-CoA carboxylase biotin carboxyl carrier protein